MSDWIGGLVGGLVTGGMNLIGQGMANYANRRMNTQNNQTNIGLTRDTNALNERLVTMTNEQNKELQYEAWHREDNAVQRRAADMAAAGFNPLLAAGAAAQSSGPVRVEAPRHEAPQTQAGRVEALQLESGIIERALRMKDDFANTRASRQLVQAQTEEHKARTEDIKFRKDLDYWKFGLSGMNTMAGTEHVKSQTDLNKQLYMFNELMNQEKLYSMRQEIHLRGQQQTLNDLRAQSERVHIESQLIDNTMKMLEYSYKAELNSGALTMQQLEIAARRTANAIAERDNNIYEWFGVSSTGSVYEKAAQGLATGAARVLDTVFGAPFRTIQGWISGSN